MFIYKNYLILFKTNKFDFPNNTLCFRNVLQKPYESMNVLDV